MTPAAQNSTSSFNDKALHKAAWISFGASVFIFALKVSAYYLTHSTAVLSDALESTVNVLASFVALIVLRFVSAPADEDHPYGHGKLEYFSAAFEGGLIFFAALMIIRESIDALLAGAVAKELEWGFALMSGTAVLNLALGLYLRRVGRRERSETIKASGAHVLSDVWTTVGVLVGLVVVLWTKLPWIDPLVAIAVALNLAYEGYKIARKSGGSLIDEKDPEVLIDLAKALEKNRTPGIIDVHNLRIIRSGRFHHVDAHLVAPEYWDISHAHAVCHEFEKVVVRDYPFDGEIAFHLDPCKQAYCSRCAMLDCPIRQAPFKAIRPFTPETLIAGPQPTETPKEYII
jgi:cation diffusion facilitator family transporter